MALFHVSHPPWLRLVGVRTSYIHFSNISWTPRALDPIINPFLGPSSWLHPASTSPVSQLGSRFSFKPGNFLAPTITLEPYFIYMCLSGRHLSLWTARPARRPTESDSTSSSPFACLNPGEPRVAPPRPQIWSLPLLFGILQKGRPAGR